MDYIQRNQPFYEDHETHCIVYTHTNENVLSIHQYDIPEKERERERERVDTPTTRDDLQHEEKGVVQPLYHE